MYHNVKAKVLKQLINHLHSMKDAPMEGSPEEEMGEGASMEQHEDAMSLGEHGSGKKSSMDMPPLEERDRQDIHKALRSRKGAM